MEDATQRTREAPAGAEPDPGRPLVVDVDGCLLRTDLVWEGLTRVVLRRPARLPRALLALLHGRPALKSYLATCAGPDLETAPLEPAVMGLIQEARAAGRPVMLASGAHASQVARLGARVGASETYGSDGRVNLTGREKLSRVRSVCRTFDYVGNHHADLPLWMAATLAFAINAGPLTVWRARRSRQDLIVLRSTRAPLQGWLRALRLHQWAKNTLLLLPALAAHLPWSPSLGLTLARGFLAFSFAASAIYLSNDLFDLQEDRQHPTKRRRPLASGEMSIPAAAITIVGLGAAAGFLAAGLPQWFGISLLAYVALAMAYSSLIKQRAIADVLMLATLYTLRVVGGAALVGVTLSRWFLAFSVFLFLSLALVKRVVELQSGAGGAGGATTGVPGRGYRQEDVAVLTSLGVAATVASSLVYCLYITSDDVVRLYTRPDLLWGGLLILLYWQARVWLLAGRRAMTEDPVVFALRDRMSLVAFGAFMLLVVLAAR